MRHETIPLKLDSQWLRRLELLAIAALRPQGGWRWGSSHVSHHRGRSLEFAGYLPYAWGDDFRTIDWKLYARLNRLFVKTYHEEVELEVHLLVDATASMGLPESDQKFPYARVLAQAIAYVALIRHHYVRLGVLSESMGRWLTPWLRHRHALGQVQAFLEPLQPGGQVNLGSWVARYLDQAHSHGGSCVLITDGMMDLKMWRSGLGLLRHRNLEVTVIQVLGAQEVEPARYWRRPLVEDAETGKRYLLQARRAPALFREAMTRHNQMLEATCRQLNIRLIRTQTDTPIEELVFRHFLRAGFFRIASRSSVRV